MNEEIINKIERLKDSKKADCIKDNFTTLFQLNPFSFFPSTKYDKITEANFYNEIYELYKMFYSKLILLENKPIVIRNKLRQIFKCLLDPIKQKGPSEPTIFEMSNNINYAYSLCSVLAFDCFLKEIQEKTSIQNLLDNISSLTCLGETELFNHPKTLSSANTIQIRFNHYDQYQKQKKHFLLIFSSLAFRLVLNDEQTIKLLDCLKLFSDFTYFDILSIKETLSLKQFISPKVVSKLFKELRTKEKVILMFDPMSNNCKLNFKNNEKNNIVLEYLSSKTTKGEHNVLNLELDKLINLQNECTSSRMDPQRNFLAIMIENYGHTENLKIKKSSKNLFCECIKALNTFVQEPEISISDFLSVFSALFSYKESGNWSEKTILDKALELMQTKDFYGIFDRNTIENINKLNQHLKNKTFRLVNNKIFLPELTRNSEKGIFAFGPSFNATKLQFGQKNNDPSSLSERGFQQNQNPTLVNPTEQLPNWTRGNINEEESGKPARTRNIFANKPPKPEIINECSSSSQSCQESSVGHWEAPYVYSPTTFIQQEIYYNPATEHCDDQELSMYQTQQSQDIFYNGSNAVQENTFQLEQAQSPQYYEQQGYYNYLPVEHQYQMPSTASMGQMTNEQLVASFPPPPRMTKSISENTLETGTTTSLILSQFQNGRNSNNDKEMEMY